MTRSNPANKPWYKDWMLVILIIICVPIMLACTVIFYGEHIATPVHFQKQAPVQQMPNPQPSLTDRAEATPSPPQPPVPLSHSRPKPERKPMKEHPSQACDEPDPSTAPPNSDWDDGNTDPGCPESDDLIVPPEGLPPPRRIIGPLP